MSIYISSAREDLPVATALSDLIARRLSGTAMGGVTIYTPPDGPASAGEDEREALAARAEQQMGESLFVVLLLSPAALRSPWVARDLDQVRRLRAAGKAKFFVTVVWHPLPPTPDLDATLSRLRSVDAVSRPLDEVAEELAYYATWRPRQTGGRIDFAPPPRPPAPAQEEDAPPPPPAPTRGAPPEPPASVGASPGAPPDAAGLPGGASPSPAPRRDREAPADEREAPADEREAPADEREAPEGEKAAAPSTSTLQFSAYHPNAVAVETWHTLLVYTYVAEALARIQADAATFTELGSAPTVARGQSARAVARGVELTIEPHMEGVTFSPASDAFVWREDWRRSLFRFSGAGALAGHEQRGWIDIFAGPMVPIARIDLTFPFHAAELRQLATASPPRGMIVSGNVYDAVFISYSHRDVEAFRQACEEYRRFGVTVYTDEQLEAGADYERELGGMIAAANVFQLLWSRHSAGSVECRKEWLAALRREPSERFIKPWYWRRPLAPLPDEFAPHHISFRYEPLKRSLWRPDTWF